MKYVTVALIFAMLSTSLNAQFNPLKKVTDKLEKNSASKLLEGKPPITTNLADAIYGKDSLDNFTPREPKRSLMALQRTPNGGFVLQPGYYEFHDQSYCLHAGTHGPGGGDGYLYAPTKGPAEDAVMSIVRNSVNRPEIPQHDIQVLLWAIIARAKFEDLDPRLKLTAAMLLTPRQLAALNRSALQTFQEAALKQVDVPEPVRIVLDAENKLRGMVTSANSSYEQMESVAVLAGLAPRGPGSIDVPAGRWSLHPDGYYIRYLPVSYTNTVLQIWVPQGSPAVGKEYDPATHIATPCNTARQRLIQSGRPYQQQ